MMVMVSNINLQVECLRFQLLSGPGQRHSNLNREAQTLLSSATSRNSFGKILRFVQVI